MKAAQYVPPHSAYQEERLDFAGGKMDFFDASALSLGAAAQQGQAGEALQILHKALIARMESSS